MRRSVLFSVVTLGVGITTLGYLLSNLSNAQPEPVETKPNPNVIGEASPVSTQLPISRVVLFSSGVGYFLREGHVEGNSRVDLTFPVNDINDLLKSMTVQDLDGGHVGAVSYDSNAPVQRTLRSFAINLDGNPSFARILNQARGEKVEVVLQQANAQQPGTLTGTIVGLEAKPANSANAMQAMQMGLMTPTIPAKVKLNLWCADGVRSFALDEVQRVRFLNPIIEGEFRQALETLALSHDTQKKAVSLSFSGEGKRKVRVGYVVENPVWKTSYRLVVSKDEKKAPYLQGWAIVENPSDEDWKNVRMALISGRPISFKMDLYSQLFNPRPTVVPELFRSLTPVTYNSAIGSGNRDALAGEGGFPLMAGSPGNLGMGGMGGGLGALGALGGGLGGGGMGAFGGFPGGAPATGGLGLGDGGDFGGEIIDELNSDLDLGRSVASMASASKLGDYFQYAIDRPVSLSRQKSAMLPIVDKNIEATRLSIYNESVQSQFPLLGLKLKNTSGLHLMQGPITVFEGSLYAGDSRILDLQPDEERIISYALDLGTEVTPSPHSSNGRLSSVRFVKGMLYTKTIHRESKDYVINNRNDKERTVFIEHPYRSDFDLVDTDKPTETTGDLYRFEVKVPAGKSKTLTVTEEKMVSESVEFTNLNSTRIRHFLSSKVVSDKVKAALQKAADLRWEMAKTQREIKELQRQLDTIVKDQDRLRQNLKAVPTASKAYKRYLDKFDNQETMIETYQEKIKKLQGTEHTQKKAFDDYLADLVVE